MSSSVYSKPPITEAVIELRTDAGGTDADLERAHRKLGRRYDTQVILQEVTFEFVPGANKAPQQHDGKKIFRSISSDGSKLANMTRELVSISSLAPYAGWADMEARAKEAWAIWRAEVGKRPLRRIGVRFINRIDIPAIGAEAVVWSDYLTIGPSRTGPWAGTIHEYSMTVRSAVGSGPFVATLNTGTVDAALIDHVSLLLDIDVYLDIDLPRRDDEMWERVAELRSLKNEIFEACVTNATKELIT